MKYFCFQLPVYHCRSLHFSSHESTADHNGDTQVDWMVDLYPKGVWFQKCFKIFTSGTMQVRDTHLLDNFIIIDDDRKFLSGC